MNKNTKIIALVSGLVVALGVTIYFWRKNVKNQEDVEEEDDEVVKQNVVVKPTDGFVEKAKALQTVLGFKGKDIDGIIGNMTKSKLSELGLNTNVTASNIDSLIEQAKQATATKKASQDSATEISERTERAKQITTALKTNRQLTWIDKPALLTTYKKDLLGEFTRQANISLPTNKVIEAVSWRIRRDGFLEVFMGSEGYIIVSPFRVSVFQ